MFEEHASDVLPIPQTDPRGPQPQPQTQREPQPARRAGPSVSHAVLVLELEEEEDREWVLTRSNSIGRRRVNRVRLNADASVSRLHCVIERRDSGWFIVDRNSNHGTIVDGEKVRDRELHGGEVIQIGSYVLRFRHG